MNTNGKEVHLNEVEASGGSKEGVVRWVLIIGTALAIAALSVIWITGALTTDDTTPPTAAEALAADQQVQAADSGPEMPTAAQQNAAEDKTEVQNGINVIEN